MITETDRRLILEVLSVVLCSSVPSVSVSVLPPSYAALWAAAVPDSRDFSEHTFHRALKECKVLSTRLHPDKFSRDPELIPNATQWFQALGQVQHWCEVLEKNSSERWWLIRSCLSVVQQNKSSTLRQSSTDEERAESTDETVEQNLRRLVASLWENVASYATVPALAQRIFAQLEQSMPDVPRKQSLSALRIAFDHHRYQWAFAQWPRRLCQKHENRRALLFFRQCCADLSHVVALLLSSQFVDVLPHLNACLQTLEADTFASEDCAACRDVNSLPSNSAEDKAFERLRRHQAVPVENVFAAHLVRYLIGELIAIPHALWSARLLRITTGVEEIRPFLYSFRMQRVVWATSCETQVSVEEMSEYATQQVDQLAKWIQDHQLSVSSLRRDDEKTTANGWPAYCVGEKPR